MRGNTLTENKLCSWIFWAKEERIFNLPYRTRLPSGLRRKDLSGCTILNTQHGFEKQTETTWKDFTVRWDFQPCWPESQKDSTQLAVMSNLIGRAKSHYKNTNASVCQRTVKLLLGMLGYVKSKFPINFKMQILIWHSGMCFSPASSFSHKTGQQ